MMVTIERSSFSSRISLHRLPFPSHLCHYQEARKKRQKAFFYLEIQWYAILRLSQRYCTLHSSFLEGSIYACLCHQFQVDLCCFKSVRRQDHLCAARNMACPSHPHGR